MKTTIYLFLALVLCSSVFAQQIPQLTYHQIGDKANNAETITAGQFNEQMKWLSDNGFKSCSFARWELNNCTTKSFILVIDDGYKDVITKFKPIMDKYNFTGGVSIVADWVNKGEMLTWNDLKLLNKTGWELLSHGKSHKDMALIDYSQADREYFLSRELIKNNTGTIPKYFIYPYNDQSARTRLHCGNYYLWCSGESSYADSGRDLYLSEKTDLFNDGLTRVKIENKTTFDRFIYTFNYATPPIKYDLQWYLGKDGLYHLRIIINKFDYYKYSKAVTWVIY